MAGPWHSFTVPCPCPKELKGSVWSWGCSYASSRDCGLILSLLLVEILKEQWRSEQLWAAEGCSGPQGQPGTTLSLPPPCFRPTRASLHHCPTQPPTSLGVLTFSPPGSPHACCPPRCGGNPLCPIQRLPRFSPSALPLQGTSCLPGWFGGVWVPRVGFGRAGLVAGHTRCWQVCGGPSSVCSQAKRTLGWMGIPSLF